MKKIYLLNWVVADSGYDGSQILGVFENKEDAIKIRDQFREKSSFEGYYVLEFPLNAYQPDWLKDEYIHLRRYLGKMNEFKKLCDEMGESLGVYQNHPEWVQLKAGAETLDEFRNSIGHALIDYYYTYGLDRTSDTQARRRAMEKIQLASNKCDVMMKAILELVSKEKTTQDGE